MVEKARLSRRGRAADTRFNAQTALYKHIAMYVSMYVCWRLLFLYWYANAPRKGIKSERLRKVSAEKETPANKEIPRERDICCLHRGAGAQQQLWCEI